MKLKKKFRANIKSTTFRCHSRGGDVKSTGTIEGWWPDFNSRGNISIEILSHWSVELRTSVVIIVQHMTDKV